MNPKILIVDDEADLQELIKIKFRKAIQSGELQFSFALNGEEALKILSQDPDISIILTDINMPVMDGLTLLTKVAALERPYKVIVVSAYGDMSNIRAAMNRGASDFITKPFDFVDFETTLRKIMEEYRTLDTALKAEKRLREVQVELDIAKMLQEAMLPTNFEPFSKEALEIAGKMIPAQSVGGDFFDFFPLGEGVLGIVIADVSGKSVSACLYMAITKSLFRAYSRHSKSCAEVLATLNEILAVDNPSCMFVTAFYGILDIPSGILAYSNAGHTLPYILQQDGTVKQIPSSPNHALGINAQLAKNLPKYQDNTLQLSCNDTVFFYTDGVTEAWNKKNELFTTARLESCLKNSFDKPVSDIVNAVIEEVNAFAHGMMQSDDLTILAIKYLGHSNEK